MNQTQNTVKTTKADNILYLDFGSTVTRFHYNEKRVAMDTTVPYNFIFKDEYLSVDKMFENIKRDWVSSDINKQAVIKYFEHIRETYNIDRVKRIRASYPTHFNHKKKHDYKSILAFVFDVAFDNVSLVSESTALLRGSKLYNLEHRIVAADIGGFTTDVFTCEKSVNINGIELGGELVTEEIAKALLDYKFSPVLDLVKAKELKEAHFEFGKMSSLKVMESIILNNATDKLVSFDELFNIVECAFDKVYNNIANYVKSFTTTDDLIYIFGGVAEINRFQEIIRAQLGTTVQFSNDTFILIDGLIADEEQDTVEVLVEDLFMPCTVSGEKCFIRIGQAGMPFPVKTKISLLLKSAKKDIVTLKQTGTFHHPDALIYRGEVTDTYMSVDMTELATQRLAMVDITVHADNIELKTETQHVKETLTIEEIEYQTQIEQKAKDIYEEELKKRNAILAERINSFMLEDVPVTDYKLFTDIKKSLQGLLVNNESLITVPVPLVKEEILTSKSYKEFFSHFSNDYRMKDYKIEKFTKAELNIFEKVLNALGLYKDNKVFTGTEFEKLYFKTITKINNNDKLAPLKKEMLSYYEKETTI